MPAFAGGLAYVYSIPSLTPTPIPPTHTPTATSTTASGSSETIRPTANGFYQEWGEQFGAGTTHWDRVEEVTADDDGSYVLDNTWNGTERDTYQLSDTSLTNIASVQVVVRAARHGSASDNNNVKVMIRSGTTDAESPVKTLSGSWAEVSHTWPLDPATGAAWTPAAVNALQAGMRNAMGPSGGGGVKVTQVYAVVAQSTQTLRPTANGTYLEWGEVGGAGTTHWDRVEEVTADDDGSYILDNTWNGTERDTFQLGDTTFATISYVEVYVRAIRINPPGTNDNNNVRVMIRSSTTDAQSAARGVAAPRLWAPCPEWTKPPSPVRATFPFHLQSPST